MSIDSVGNFLTVIRNALQVSKRSVTVPFSTMKMGIADVLKQEGFIRDFEIKEGERQQKFLVVHLKYFEGKPVINQITRISTPGRRHYEGLRNLTPVIGGLGISVLSTNAGIMTDKQARKLLVGGEVLCHVW